jgi:hypothetical protein
LQAAEPEVLKVLGDRAKLFVGIGWLLFVVSVPMCFAISAMAGFNKFYFPAHQTASLDAFDIKATTFVLAAGAFVAIASSVAFALKFRVLASVLVVAIWSVIIFGTQGARLLVKPGPEYFERRLGQQVYLVPWQYAPVGIGQSADQDPRQIGFSATLCLSNLKGTYDQDCRGGQQLQLTPKDRSFALFDIHLWEQRGSQVTPEPGRDGYQSFVGNFTLPNGGPADVVHYFVRQDSGGRLTRLVTCRLNSDDSCSHNALVGEYWLSYRAPLAEGDVLDVKLAALLESWRRK